MGSVYQDPAQTPTSSDYYHPVPPMPSRPNSFYNTSNILSAALEPSPAADYYAEVDMTSYYRPPPPVSTPSGFYDFDVGTDSNNNPLMSSNNGSSSYTEAAGVGGLPERPAGVANPPPIPRATRPVSLAPSPNNASNDNRAAIPPTPYSPPPLPTISTTARSQDGYGASTQSPVSPSSGPLVGGRTPRSIHGSGGRRA
ncbi:hypothetical protein F5H01DRAFT_337291 [Linnemannia elongata]|nr:hypothetical protein F5H01DRAFT_337291 [Linnemannia elongata]